MLRITQVRLNVNEPVSKLPEKIGRALRMKNFQPVFWRIVRESIDARQKPDIFFVYTVDFEVENEEAVLKRASRVKGASLFKTEAKKYEVPVFKGEVSEEQRPVIVGFGPCGMFAALILAEAGLRPLILERGRRVEERTRDVEHFWETGELDLTSNVQFGEGGAGTFSDGKLTTGIKDVRIAKVNGELIEAGADESIGYVQMPHIGTDVLRTVVRNIRKKIVSLGGEIRFESCVTGIETGEAGSGNSEDSENMEKQRYKRYTGNRINMKNEDPEKNENYMGNSKYAGEESSSENGSDVLRIKRLNFLIINSCERLKTENAVFAPGNSARDTFRMLYKSGVRFEAKPFSVGVRIEHPQQLINEAQYGAEANDSEGRLGAAAYKLSYHCGNGRGVYTFCMCPGGFVVGAASGEKGVVTNGMSYFARDGENANSALLVSVEPSDYVENENPLSGIDFQETLERKAYEAGGGRYFAPVQRVGDFLGKGEKGESADGGQKLIFDKIRELTVDEMEKLSEGVKHAVVNPTYRPGVTWTEMDDVLPDFVVEAMREALPEMAGRISGFDMENAVLTGVETRSSSPVRMLRNSLYESVSVEGIYPGGEGAGYAGGIMSAAVDGIKIAEALIEKLNRNVRLME